MDILLVNSEMAQRSEQFSTDCAFMISLGYMGIHVYGKIRGHYKSLATLCTKVTFLI